MEELIREYGYLALSAGTMMEGETALLVASSLVDSGLLFWPYVVVFGFLGGFVNDWICFLIGRFSGRPFLEARPKLQARLGPVTSYFANNRLQILLSYRFLYGFRTLLPIVIGMSGIGWSELLAYSVISGFSWAATVGTIGWLAGYLFHLGPANFQEHYLLIILFFACVGLSIGLTFKTVADRRMKIS